MILFGIAAVLALAPDGQARGGFERHTGLLDFSYSWSAEAAAVPEIVSDFHNQAEMFYSEILEKTSTKQIYSERWRTAGTTPLLLSLIGAGFHGGATARPKSWINVLLWDRKAGWISSFDALLAQLMRRDPRSSSSSMIAPACPSRTFMTMRGLSDSNRPASRSECGENLPSRPRQRSMDQGAHVFDQRIGQQPKRSVSTQTGHWLHHARGAFAPSSAFHSREERDDAADAILQPVGQDRGA
jgi:hypothetical protein